MMRFFLTMSLRLTVGLFFFYPCSAQDEASVARKWNEALLTAIRNDLARPPVHARNLFHVSAAMWDAWATYSDTDGAPYLHEEEKETPFVDDIQKAQEEALSFAAYRILLHRFADSVGRNETFVVFHELMDNLGYARNYNATEGDSPAALGNRIATTYIEFGLEDGSNEADNFGNTYYAPVNPPLVPTREGNRGIWDPNRWQPLWLDVFVDQSGNTLTTGPPEFQSPEWGQVTPFSLTDEDRTVYTRDDNEYWVFHDPGPPPLLFGEDADLYKSGFEQVLLWSGLLDPTLNETLDISPASRGRNTLGTNDGEGYTQNPFTQRPYTPQHVPAGDYYRVLAEFWADGPDSETPPGHWFTIANMVSYHEQFTRIMDGRVVDPLEWDVKLYFALGGALHDAAIAAWSTKGWYDYVRPISAIRYMAGLGQCSDPNATDSYHPDGIHLYPGQIELTTEETLREGGKHHHLIKFGSHLPGSFGIDQTVGRIAVKAWRGPSFIQDPETDTAGVGWILAEDWWPYQRPNFVTPPFAAYVSGHSTFSRAAARVLTDMTGSAYFPGGLGEFHTVKDEFLVFEQGPSVNVTLQWATYFDAADECSLSRIYGGIHPTADDIPGRIMGEKVGAQATLHARRYFAGVVPQPVTTAPAGTAVLPTPQLVPLSFPIPSPTPVALAPITVPAPVPSPTSPLVPPTLTNKRFTVAPAFFDGPLDIPDFLQARLATLPAPTWPPLPPTIPFASGSEPSAGDNTVSSQEQARGRSSWTWPDEYGTSWRFVWD